eukprot:1273840-Pyramimonas_sp.AAC.1
MPPFLVPTAEVPQVPGSTNGKAVLPKYSAASGAAGWPLTHMHYTNIHRIWDLAPTHPMVITSQTYKTEKERDPAEFDQFGRAVKYHHGPFDLILSVSARVEMRSGCSVNGAANKGVWTHFWAA